MMDGMSTVKAKADYAGIIPHDECDEQTRLISPGFATPWTDDYPCLLTVNGGYGTPGGGRLTGNPSDLQLSMSL